MAAKYLANFNGWLLWGDLISMLMQQPCQDSELLLGKDIWTDSKESMLMPFGLRIMQLGLELTNSFFPEQDFDWTYSVYGDVHEILPDDMPEPLYF